MKIAVDTNVLVRAVLNDDPAQSRAARKLLREASAALMSLSRIALGTPALLQALRLGPVGSGYLAGSEFSAIYIGPSVAAVRAGGLALAGGMAMIGGLAEILLSRVLPRLRPFLPPEFAGLVIFLVGPRVTDWLSKGVVKQHRTLASYLNLLAAAGFRLTRIAEWAPSLEQVAAHPDWADERIRPLFLLAAATR